jgi:hypothetical protein
MVGADFVNFDPCGTDTYTVELHSILSLERKELARNEYLPSERVAPPRRNQGSYSGGKVA